MRFKQLFCIIVKALIVFCEINFVFLNSCHIIDSYVIFDRIIVLYMCLTLLNVTFHVNAINFVSVNVWFVILFCNFLTCDFHFNFVFICNSKIRMFVFEINCIFSKLIVICMLNFFELLFRWISLYFVEKKIASWRRNHVVRTSCSFSKILQFFSVLLLYINTFTSSTNSMTVVFFSRLFAYIKQIRVEKQIQYKRNREFLRNLCVYFFYRACFFFKDYWKSTFF